MIGVHAPEFAFEKDPNNVMAAVRNLGITYPVALDNNHAIWRAFANQYWPAHYFIDGEGRIRYHHFGEGGYTESEKVIQRLLAESGKAVGDMSIVKVAAGGVGAAAGSKGALRSPETYVGYKRAANFVSPGGPRHNVPHDYAIPALANLNDWALGGNWTVGSESATSNASGGRIAFKFRARDLHLVLGPSTNGHEIRFRIKIDGRQPANDRGLDVSADGTGLVTGQRLYQLVRMAGPVGVHTFEMEFIDPGAQAFAFTFG